MPNLLQKNLFTSILKDLSLSYLNNAKLTTEKPVHFYTERPQPKLLE